MDPAVLNHYTHGMLQSGNVAQNNFLTVQKIVDYAYLQERNMVSLPESLGSREVSSQSVPAGPKVNV